jgi:hypothetical protein
VVVVDVLGRPLLADEAHPALRLDHRVDLSRGNAVAPLQVVMPAAAVKPLSRFTPTGIVAGLAVRPAALARSWEVGKSLDLVAIWATPEARNGGLLCLTLHGLALRRNASLVGVPATHTIAVAAVDAVTVLAEPISRKF